MKKDDVVLKLNAYTGNDSDGNPIFGLIFLPVSEIYMIMEYSGKVVGIDEVPKESTSIIYLYTAFGKQNTICVKDQTAEELSKSIFSAFQKQADSE